MEASVPGKTPFQRETIVVNGTFAMRTERLRAAREGATGRQVLTVELMAHRMAGGFLRMARARDLRRVLGEVLRDPDLKLGELDAIKELPGMASAAAASLMKLWLSGVGTEGGPEIRDHPRMRSLAALEAAVLAALPADLMRPQDLIALACGRAEHAPRIMGRVVFRGMTELHPAWRPLLSSLSRFTEVVWDCGSRIGPPDWIAHVAKVISCDPENPEVAAETAATPRHEAVEALRWARRLVTEEGVDPGDVAIAAADTSAYDDHFVSLKAETDLPLHIAHGIPVVSTRDGQAAAALADVLLRGLSQKRVRRLVDLCGIDEGRFAELPTDWSSHLREDAGLASVELWERALSRTPKAARTAEVLLPVIRLLGEGKKAAKEAGAEILRGQALAIWNEALIDGPAGALDATLKARNAPDREDFSSSVCYMSAETLAASPRPYVRLIGLSSRSWPRGSREDALVPDRLVPSRTLDPLPAYEADARDFWTIVSAAKGKVALSWPRRDADGRAVGVSSLVGELDRRLNAAGRAGGRPGLREGAVHLRRVRIPSHAFSESDRLAARAVEEFSATPAAKSAIACWSNWHKDEVTPHDGLVRPGHPRIEEVLSRHHSATSIRRMLRDPLGFVWKYALGFDAHDSEDAPLFLDARAFGKVVHDILQRAVKNASQAGGYASVPEEQLRGMVETAAADAGRAYEIANPVPPRLVWESSVRKAEQFALTALMADVRPLKGQKSLVEVPFGGAREWMPEDVPWDPYAEVSIPGAGLKLYGVIDRIDLAARQDEIRVIDYKSGKAPGKLDGIVLDGGKELQRCIYGYAVKSLLGNVKVEAGLLYPATGQYAPAENLGEAMDALSGYVSKAKEALFKGHALPGIDADDRYNDMLFALPANAQGTYLARKKQRFIDLLGDATEVWEAP